MLLPFRSKTYKLTRMILVHIKLSTVSLPQINSPFFIPVHTNRKNGITPASFSVTYPYTEDKENLALAVRTCNISRRFLCWYPACIYPFQDPGTGSVLQVSRSVYCWETDAACRHFRLSQKINSTTMLSNVVPLQWNVLLSTFGFPKSTNIHLGTVVAQWLRCCATNREVAGSIPAGVLGIFHWHKILPIAIWPWGRLSL